MRKGQDLLSHNDFTLGSQISAETLNHIIEEGPKKGRSVAYCLAWSSERIAPLEHNNYILGSQISAETLNHVIQRGWTKGESVAYLLAKTEEGQALLKHNEYELGKLIINRAERAPGFEGEPRYFEDPEILRRLMKKCPDLREEIKSEAPSHVERLQDYMRLTTTCKSLNLKKREVEAAKVRSQQSASENVDMNLNSLDSREQEAIVSLIGLCLFTESSSDASVTFNPSLHI